MDRLIWQMAKETGLKCGGKVRGMRRPLGFAKYFAITSYSRRMSQHCRYDFGECSRDLCCTDNNLDLNTACVTVEGPHKPSPEDKIEKPHIPSYKCQLVQYTKTKLENRQWPKGSVIIPTRDWKNIQNETRNALRPSTARMISIWPTEGNASHGNVGTLNSN
jgi:hypothetical protein